ncbi:putative metalloprotease with PDZ domain [Duganella sp. 1411]|uniref:M61 family metallopeptidase n=1 Tax=Duganella sp. 1411 TaxID=2806572 RepID=UPI001AE72736|nr:M61 family metallopeptidase [Duganella sp. 1411]MBP1205678.1 putative metalloprotease with PDZ domain [Duganella sp. 1411]
MKNTFCALLLLIASAAATAAPASLPAPRDLPFKGDMTLSVDATDQVHKILRVRQTIPVQGKGKMVLMYPQWETDSHSATQQLTGLAGLIVTAGGRRVEWLRDGGDPYAFHVDVPHGARELEVEFQFLSPTAGNVLMSPDMLTLPWQKVALYPAGWFIRNIAVRAELKLPAGFQYATSLETAAVRDQLVSFKPTTFDDLVDAPVHAGRYFRRVDLAPGAARPIHLNMIGDNEAALAIPPAMLDKYRAMATALPALFRSQHYRHYDFLLTLSDILPAGGGREHQESSENALALDFFTRPDAHLPMADLIVHEYAHSWNGRFRQPADLWSPTLNQPVRGSLLWVYEGQTEFWGRVLAARLGLRTRQQTLDALAVDAANAAARAGRQWKSLQDSTNDALYMPGRQMQWRDWQRREDYYGEGVLLWLDVDMLLRERTGGRAGLADFAGAFFGANNALATSTYTFADVCRTLNAIAPYDWSGYFTARLRAHDDSHLLDGLARAGYRLVYTDEATEYFVQNEDFNVGGMDLSASLGLTVGKKGVVKTVAWEGPAFRAGVGIGAKLTQVGGLPYSDDALKQAIKAAAASGRPIALGFDADGRSQTVLIPYYGSLRYPRLERIPGKPDQLERLLAPSPSAT